MINLISVILHLSSRYHTFCWVPHIRSSILPDTDKLKVSYHKSNYVIMYICKVFYSKSAFYEHVFSMQLKYCTFVYGMIGLGLIHLSLRIDTKYLCSFYWLISKTCIISDTYMVLLCMFFLQNCSKLLTAIPTKKN